MPTLGPSERTVVFLCLDFLRRLSFFYFRAKCRLIIMSSMFRSSPTICIRVSFGLSSAGSDFSNGLDFGI